MKKIIIEGQDLEIEVLTDWDNNVVTDIPELSLKKGDSLTIFWRNYKSFFSFTSEPYYTQVYHPAEKLKYLLAKKPELQRWIDEFELILAI